MITSLNLKSIDMVSDLVLSQCSCCVPDLTSNFGYKTMPKFPGLTTSKVWNFTIYCVQVQSLPEHFLSLSGGLPRLGVACFPPKGTALMVESTWSQVLARQELWTSVYTYVHL